jgi:predicted PurR-regulated permease PerM
LQASIVRSRFADITEMALRMFRQNRSGEEIIQLAIRLGLLVVLIYWCLLIVRPFIPIFAWGVVLAVALYPAFSWLSERLGDRPKLAALILTIVNLAIVIGPAAWLGLGMIEGLRNLSEQIGAGALSVPAPPAAIKDWPIVGPQLFELWRQASTNLEAAFRELAPYLKPLVGPILAIAGDAGVGTLKFLASVALAGFLFPSGPKLVAASRDIMARLIPGSGEDFVALAGATIRTVSQGVIGIALLQAFLSGVGFKFLGIESAGLLAFAVLIFAILQLGAAIVLIPTVIWLWTAKDFTTAFLMTIYFGVVGLSDNALKPLVMGRGLNVPMLVIFVGVLGGTLAHGLVGLFIGPVILAVGWELIIAWSRGEQSAAALQPAARVSAHLEERSPAESEVHRAEVKHLS